MQRLDLFKGGRDVHPRHRTLRATIEWSHDLLEPEERELFARLSVFAGGCTLEAAEAVTEVDLDVLQALVEKSLLRQSAERFWMLELIRGYAAERLEDGGTVEELRRRHAEHFVGFAERIEPELMRDRQAEWLELLDNDHSNARSALAFLLERGDFERTLRLVGALAMFWLKKGYLSEGRRWLEATLRATDGQRTAARAKALGGAALLASLQGDWPETARWGTEGRRLSLELGEPRYASTAMLTLGRALLATGEREGAIAQFEEAAASAVEAGNSDAIAMAAFNLGYAALDDGDLERARREFGRVVEQSGADRYVVARAHAALGSVALHEHRVSDAAGLLRRSLRISHELRARDDTVAWALELLGVTVCESRPEWAARLLGSAEALRAELGGRTEGIESDLHERALATLRSRLDAAELSEAWNTGRRASLEQTLGEVLARAV